MIKHTFVRTLSGDLEIDHIRETVEELKSSDLQFLKWFPRAALIQKSSGTATHLYTGQQYDPNHFILDPQGWSHDHCVICFKTISDMADGNSDDAGYYNESDWVCRTCFEDLVKPEDLEEKLSSLEKYEK